jgi:arylsulfatase A-like enzyme
VKRPQIMTRFCLSVLVTLATAGAGEAAPPNVVIMLADDLGWGDIRVHGGEVPTPNIDRLFREGVELKNFMVWCVCSPTRAMLLTARHPFRVGTGPEVGGELDAGETTIAEGFRANGYRTGVFGKWHNGEDPATEGFLAAYLEAYRATPRKRPPGGLGANAHGFDEAWVYYGGGADYFNRKTVQGRGPVSWWHDREFRPRDEGYTDDMVTRHAREFIRGNKDRPFFCYVPFHLIHAPMQAKQEDEARVSPDVKAPAQRTYDAMVLALDGNVGAILDELETQGLASNTIVLFASDNGATPEGNNQPFRGTKHTLYDGGVHVPAVLRWPAGGLAGGRKWGGLCGALDVFPTLIELAGLKMPDTRPRDGRSVAAAVRDGAASPVESYYWAWHNYDAVRTGRWKLLRYADHNELYDVQADVGEVKDLAGERTEVVGELTTRLDAWAASLGAALSHRPAPGRADEPPAPRGDVLDVRVTQVGPVTGSSGPLVVNFATTATRHYAQDVIEYDLCIAADSGLSEGVYYTPFKGLDPASRRLTFRKGIGFDQFGREQVQGPPTRGGPGVWEHRRIGYTAGAPTVDAQHGLVFNGKKAGTYHILIDNVRVQHADGSVTPVWSDARDTASARAGTHHPAFKDLSVGTVPYSATLSGPRPEGAPASGGK